MASFNTNMRQMTKTSQQKKQAGGYIIGLNTCPCPINILDFWYYRHNIKDGLDNSEFAILYDLMAMFTVCHILLHHQKNYFCLLIMLKQIGFKLAKTKTLKENAKQALSRSQQNGCYIPKPEN